MQLGVILTVISCLSVVVVDRPGIVEDAGRMDDGVGAILSLDVVKHAERMEGAQNSMRKTSKRMDFWISPHVVGSFGSIPAVDSHFCGASIRTTTDRTARAPVARPLVY